jgi:hypothetical protein
VGNATLAKGEHELQLLRRLHSIWVTQSQVGSVDFQKVKQIASPGVSAPLLKTLPHLFSFALKASGGMTPWLVQETEAFVRAHASSTKTLGCEIWEALSQDVKGTTQFLRFRHAMVTRQHVQNRTFFYYKYILYILHACNIYIYNIYIYISLCQLYIYILFIIYITSGEDGLCERKAGSG